mmetsp:Transcript_27303/g.81565  ORF Transcript_27303/g.81565 Transcript_27303/m.81565 type:complete len:210 (+) Transcript_27303:174-803(+)
MPPQSFSRSCFAKMPRGVGGRAGAVLLNTMRLRSSESSSAIPSKGQREGTAVADSLPQPTCCISGIGWASGCPLVAALSRIRRQLVLPSSAPLSRNPLEIWRRRPNSGLSTTLGSSRTATPSRREHMTREYASPRSSEPLAALALVACAARWNSRPSVAALTTAWTLASLSICFPCPLMTSSSSSVVAWCSFNQRSTPRSIWSEAGLPA